MSEVDIYEMWGDENGMHVYIEKGGRGNTATFPYHMVTAEIIEFCAEVVARWGEPSQLSHDTIKELSDIFQQP